MNFELEYGCLMFMQTRGKEVISAGHLDIQSERILTHDCNLLHEGPPSIQVIKDAELSLLCREYLQWNVAN